MAKEAYHVVVNVIEIEPPDLFREVGSIGQHASQTLEHFNRSILARYFERCSFKNLERIDKTGVSQGDSTLPR